MNVTFLVTASCNGKCHYCSVKPWMEANQGYQMSMKEVADFISCSLSSDYRFGTIGLAGGEPLLWKHLINAARIIHGIGIAEKIEVITNGLAVKDRPKSMIEVLSGYATIRVSKYADNIEEVQYLTDNFDNVVVADCATRAVTPDHFVPDTLPADCLCRRIGYTQGTVTPCGPVRSMGYMLGNPVTLKKEGFVIKDRSRYETKLRLNFLDHFKDFQTTNQPYCQACVANKKIHKHIDFVENTVKI